MSVVATLKDGRTVAAASTTTNIPAPGNYVVTVTVSNLDVVEKVIHYKFTVTPMCDPGKAVNETISGNAVTVNLVGCAAGTTLTLEMVVVGH